MNKSQQELQKTAWQLREIQGKAEAAIPLLHNLSLDLAAQHHWPEVFDVLIDIVICWNILGRRYSDQTYYQNALLTLENAKTLIGDDLIHRPQYYLYQGEVLMSLKKYPEAELAYKAYLKQKTNMTISETGNVLRHIGQALYYQGHQEDGIAIIQEGLSKIRHNDELYPKLVSIWETGALIALAETSSQPEVAQSYAQEALKIAREHQLTQRQEQIEELIDQITSR